MNVFKIPILMYHSVSESVEAKGYSISKKNFEEQLRFLNERRFKTVLPQDVISLSGNGKHNDKYVMITFDDGYQSDYSVAYPLLKQYNFKSVHFVVSDLVGKSIFGKKAITWKQLKDMKRDGFSIQSHSCSHAFLDSLSEKELKQELSKSKDTIQSHVKGKVDFISCPGGRYSEKIRELLSTSGYKGVFTSRPGASVVEEDEILIFPRFIIKDSIDMEEFHEIVYLNRPTVILKNTGYCIKSFFRRTIGDRMYYGIWKKFN